MTTVPPSENDSIFGRFRERFKLPLNTFLKRTGHLIAFDAIKFDEWIGAGDEKTVDVAERKFGAGSAELVLECCKFSM